MFWSKEIPFSGGIKYSICLGASCAALFRATVETPVEYIKVRK